MKVRDREWGLIITDLKHRGWSVPFLKGMEKPSVMCPKTDAKAIVNIACASCDSRAKIDFGLQEVECLHPASRSADVERPKQGKPDEDGIISLEVRGWPPIVSCPRGNATYSVEGCYQCFCAVTVLWDEVRCAFPHRGNERTPLEGILERGIKARVKQISLF